MSSEDFWFEPKRYGYGAGLPIAWQGWALLFGFIATAIAAGSLAKWDPQIGGPVAIVLLIGSTLAFIAIVKAKTRGGWRWRWGSKD